MNYELEIDVQDTKKLMDSDEEMILIDCREPNENDYCNIEGGVLIPMKQTGKRLDEIAEFKDKRVVVY